MLLKKYIHITDWTIYFMDSLVGQNDTIHVSFSVWDLSDSYNKYAGVALVSLLENTHSHVSVHLLYDENLHADSPTYSENKQAYRDIEEKYGCEISYHHVDAPEWLHSLPSVRYYSFGTFLRLFLPDVLPNVNKVIYLDCDVCVTADISDLWVFDLNGKSIGVDEQNFNAGVIIFDLDKIRQNYNLAKQTLEFLDKNPRTRLLDQDALQHVFKDDYSTFDRMWNITTPYHSDYAGKNGIFHFIWTKPWKVWTGGTFAEHEFWRYFAKTPWGDDIEKLADAFANCSNLSLPHAKESANRLINYSLTYRLRYWLLFTQAFVSLHWRELRIRVKDLVFFWRM